MNKLAFASLLVLVAVAPACKKHKCDLSNGSDKETFGDIAPMTHGAFSCFVSNGELVASHGDTTVDKVTDKYKAFLDKDGWSVSVEDKHGERANGNPYDGKLIKSEKGGKKVTTLVYPLTTTIIETDTAVK